MVDLGRIGVALLAAGASRRFGDADKLAQPFAGKRLGEHGADALPKDRFESLWVISSTRDHPCEEAWKANGFELAHNPDAGEGMGTSVALAARLAMSARLNALLIALADMPCVPPAHFLALIDAVHTAGDIAVSANDNARMPPAIFGSDHFEELAKLEGDKGARYLLAQGTIVHCPVDWLIDIDTPESLREAELRVRSPN